MYNNMILCGGRRGLRPVPAEPAAARAVSRAALGRRLRLPWPGLRPGQAALRAARAALETALGPAESCAFGRAPRRPPHLISKNKKIFLIRQPFDFFLHYIIKQRWSNKNG